MNLTEGQLRDEIERLTERRHELHKRLLAPEPMPDNIRAHLAQEERDLTRKLNDWQADLPAGAWADLRAARQSRLTGGHLTPKEQSRIRNTARRNVAASWRLWGGNPETVIQDTRNGEFDNDPIVRNVATDGPWRKNKRQRYERDPEISYDLNAAGLVVDQGHADEEPSIVPRRVLSGKDHAIVELFHGGRFGIQRLAHSDRPDKLEEPRLIVVVLERLTGDPISQIQEVMRPGRPKMAAKETRSRLANALAYLNARQRLHATATAVVLDCSREAISRLAQKGNATTVSDGLTVTPPPRGEPLTPSSGPHLYLVPDPLAEAA